MQLLSPHPWIAVGMKRTHGRMYLTELFRPVDLIILEKLSCLQLMTS